jgi:hypothetical protein
LGGVVWIPVLREPPPARDEERDCQAAKSVRR